MRTWKHFTFAAILAIIAFTACDNGKDDPPTDNPKDQSTLISGLFGGNYTATVKGHFTDAQ